MDGAALRCAALTCPETAPHHPRVHRLYAYAVSALILGAVSRPLWLPASEDDFPVSTYPMFARPKPRTVEVLTALAVWPSGEERPVPSRYIANDEPMMNAGRPLATGRVRELVDILAELEPDDDEDGRAAPAASMDQG